MFRKSSVICSLFFVMLTSAGAYAIGPAEVMIYGGPSASNYTGGYDIGASVLINLPLLPKAGVEVERSTFADDVSITKLGFVYEQTLIPFLLSFKISAGSSTINSSASFTVG